MKTMVSKKINDELRVLTGLIFHALAVVALVATATGCVNKDSGAPVTQGRGSRMGGDAWSASSGVTLTGAVYGDDPQGFEEAARGLVSASIDSNSLGNVSERASDGSGVFFGGRVAIKSDGAIDPQSRLLVAVYDQYVGQQDASGQKALPVQIGMTQATGRVYGNNVNLRFQDSRGTITLEGSVSGQTFSGSFSFDNNVDVNGGKGQAYTPMGQFSIPACSFFVCN